ncbi:uncharacterized protein TrAFT101_007250 [Trichoderma asperellum]|uniref:Uncharacterized protein n=1 Tax=Trichoderma asperellum (strain ATCC 204424 / CBS 433.97 / NBRC 101777) TaxID=1042311 RepID=A0A2T3YWD9_TRIA4|nr:hypothetical protein M441DRAFT_61605 [Trichoderma asperellum CBS 433.97]PTB36885.1 hypothetical protein M441DRAFT_61605 [Trichoderma asperellum CBS 433.97]UKZ92290.1 hypothetical protein TrAFT101_007250 [Trichoderma asperellum]
MIHFIRFLLLVLPAFSVVAQTSYCTFDQIRRKDVSGCICQGHKDDCDPVKGCDACGFEIKERRTHSKAPQCPVGCTAQDWNCRGCGIWYTTLCNSLQLCLKGSKCVSSNKISKNGPSSWILLPQDEPLITNTDLLPGILEMANNPGKYGDAFDFAQRNYDPDKQALALNSVRTRTMEQFHIHVCSKPTTQNPRVIKRLQAAKLNPTKELLPIPKLKPTDPNLWCKSVASGKGPVTDFVQSIHALFQKPKAVCKEIAGAAIVQDFNKNRWGCVTDSKDGPLPDFCSGYH